MKPVINSCFRSYALLPALVAAGLLGLAVSVSCQKQSGAEVLPEKGRIAFKVEGVDVNVHTRATVVDASTLNSNGFYASAVTGAEGSDASAWNSVLFTKESSYFVANKWWPSSNPSYRFYASNLAISAAAAGATVSATNSTDVVCAYLSSSTYEAPNSLTFNHIFARIGDVTISAVNGYTITNVHATITPKTGGTYNIRTGNGAIDGTGWSSLTTGSATELANTTPGTKSNDLYLVPGSYDISFTWTASKGDYTVNLSKTVTGVSIQGGKVNAITAGLTGDASAIQFTVSVVDWGAGTVAIGTVPTS